jgi:hypothetical protein
MSMGAGGDPLRTAYGAGLGVALPPDRTLLAAAVVCYAVFLALLALYLFLGREGRVAVQPPASPTAADVTPPTGSHDPWPDAAELGRTELLPLLLTRLARLATLDALPEVRVSPEKQRLARAALLSTYRDCDALGAGDEARAVLRANGRELRPGSEAEMA